MKTILFYCMLMLSVACQTEEEAVPVNPPAKDTIDPSKAVLLKQGTIMGVGHTASGKVSLYEQNGGKIVFLDPFSSQSGPDLKVYLSKDIGASNYIKLGVLKSTMGSQSYAVPLEINANDYHYVHIWCERYSVEFARAEIKP